MKKAVIIGLILAVLFIAFLVWLFVESSKPLPGQKFADLGREHIKIGKVVEYNSNPPTSGPHYPDWVRAGVYDTERDDRNLVHSLEHGYVIMYYKCVIATTSETRGTQSTPSSEIATATPSGGPRDNNEEGCRERRGQLAQVYEKKGKRKLIVVPRPRLETNFVLTAWTYLDKFDDFDAGRIERFIDTHRDNGPERTME